jgi:hypothetical protein
VVSRALLVCSIGASLLVLASFGLFAIDQFGGASEHQQVEIAEGAPHDPGVTPPPAHRGEPRAFIDGAARTLTRPFEVLQHSPSDWVRRLFPTLLALLVYGFGLGFASRYARGLP